MPTSEMGPSGDLALRSIPNKADVRKILMPSAGAACPPSAGRRAERALIHKMSVDTRLLSCRPSNVPTRWSVIRYGHLTLLAGRKRISAMDIRLLNTLLEKSMT
jgi:hypothetical protein